MKEKIYQMQLESWEYSTILKICKKRKLNFVPEWSDMYQDYILFNMDIKRSSKLLWFIDQELKKKFDERLANTKEKLDAKHKCLRR